MSVQEFGARHVGNANASKSRAYGGKERAILSRAAFERARAEIASWPGYRATPLLAMPGLAKALKLGAVSYKDESRRFGLKSFKALGGAYAVYRILERHLETLGVRGVKAAELLGGAHRDETAQVTVACATDGNHGRSVAWGAAMFGARCRIYLHAHVSEAREAEIARYGARIERVTGTYDDSVRRCADDAKRHGWTLIADTSSGGDVAVPALVMQGYAVMVDEMLQQMDGAPSHVFVQGGVGGLAAAVAGHLWEELGRGRPTIVVVEPIKADCIFRSIAAGVPTPAEGDIETFMACLSAGEISPAAWPFLKHAVDHVLALPEAAAPAAMRLLAEGVEGDPPVVSGESGCVAIAGLIEAARDPAIRAAVGLDADARIVAIGSEGATDPATYEQVVGRKPEAVVPS